MAGRRPGWFAVMAAVARSAGATLRLMVRGRLRSPKERLGTVLEFPDGTRSVVFRETRAEGRRRLPPSVLIVEFRLRMAGPRRRVVHALFRTGCVVNTPLFVGFAGFRTKLWMADRGTGGYRGLYEWDGAGQAAAYASSLVRILSPVSVPGSVRYRIIPDLHLDEYLELLRGPERRSRIAAGPDRGDRRTSRPRRSAVSVGTREGGAP